ncbi:MAG: hypothetical protein IJP10_05945 [Clostridia bacterium]|nr:hypothetical protein [Clostridia bacterium]
MAYSSNNGGKPQNVPQRKRYQQKTQKYSEKYGSNRPNPYTGYLPPGTHPGGIYRPDAIDSRRNEAQPNIAPPPAVNTPQQTVQPVPPVHETPAARVHRREYSPNRKKNRPSITTEAPSVSENEALLRRMDEIRREAASETAAAQAPKPAPAPAPQSAQPEIRLSPEGKPLIAIPLVGENGETEMRWIPVVMPEESRENAAAAVAPVIIADTDGEDEEQNGTSVAPVIAADIDLPDTDSKEPADDEEPAAKEPAAAVIIPEAADENEPEDDRETETDSDTEDGASAVPLIIPEQEEPEQVAPEQDTPEEEPEKESETVFEDDFDDEFDDEFSEEESENISDDPTDDEEESLEPESDNIDDTPYEDEFETEPEDEAENDMLIYTDEDLINSEDSQTDEELLEDEEVFEETDLADDDIQDDIEESEDDSDTDEYTDETESDEEDEDTSDDEEEEQVLIYTDEDLDGDDESEDEEYEDDDFEESKDEEDEDEVEEESDDEAESDEDDEDEPEDEDEEVEDEEDDDMIIAPSFVKRTLTTSSYTMHRTQEDDDEDDDMRVYSPSSESDSDDILSKQDDALFIRRNHPEGSTAVFEIPKGIKLPSYIDDDEFLEQWLSEGDDMGNISKKTKRKISTIAGAMTLALALVGLGFILLTLFSSLQTCSSKSSKNDEYVDFIMPVVYTDIGEFESWEAIGKDKLLECSLVAAIDSADTPYPTDDSNRSLVPSADVLAQTKRLFGESATIDFESMSSTISAESSGYFYDDLNDVFHVEQTGFGDVAADIIGSPKVKSGTIEFTVGYKSASAIADDDAEQSYYKTMEYILNRTEDGYYIAKLREYKTED